MKKIPNMTARTIKPFGDELVLYRWNIGPFLRGKGFKAVDLWADGPAFTLDDCRAIGFSELVPLRHKGRTPMPYAAAAKTIALLNEKACARPAAEQQSGNGDAPKIRTRREPPGLAPMSALIDDYLAWLDGQVKAGEIGTKTAVIYQVYARRVRATFGPTPPAAITKEIAKAWVAKIKATPAVSGRLTGGINAALKAGAMLTRILKWAEGRDKWAPLLPDQRAYRELDLEKPAARLRVGLPAEMETLLRAFDFPDALYAELETPLGDRVLKPSPSMGDALIAMLWTAARVNDALSLTRENVAGARIVYRQQKTGRAMDLPLLFAFKDRLPAMLARADAVRANGRIDALIVNEEDGRPYWRERPKSKTRDHRPFNDRWNAYVDLAGKIVPSIAGQGKNRLGEPWSAFRAQDCRDTAVTRLSLSGADIAQIAAWHGSSVEEVTKLAKHYMQISGEHADAGGDKLVDMCRKMGIAV